VKIFEDFFGVGGGLQFIGRYLHVLSGITWIGLLYFFNFVQVPAFAEMEPGARSEALRKITWRALWWFRWAAAATFALGILLLGIYSSDSDAGYLKHPSGASIITGMLFGITMFANVWMVIWPAQKINIGSAERVAAGGEADPNAPAAAKKGARASRCNTYFSITMLWFMVFTTHYAYMFGNGTSGVNHFAIYIIFVLILWAVVEASALGYIGGLDNAINKFIFDDHKKTIIYGFVYLAVIYFVGWELIMKP
jgi:uncharacterized membrane protein